jgi:dynein heavy chain
MIWACGAHFKQKATRFIDNIFRDFFSRLLIPLVDSVFEYYFDESKLHFVHWKEALPQFTYPQQQHDFYSLVVPTVDTVRFSTHLQMLTQISKPVFITGTTGTGKSMMV